jgi:ribosome recycling factor
VEYYGATVPLQQLATFQVPEARMLIIKPHDRGSIAAIEKGIQSSDLGVSPGNDGVVIRVILPPLTEERRKEIVKKVKGESETAKVAIRNIRKDINENIKKLQKDGLPEDDAKTAEASVQKTTDSYIKKVDDLTAAKEAEVMHV